MFKVLEHLFITKKYPKEMDEEKRSAYGILSSVLGIICNIFLCLAKIIVGLIFASISIVIDGFNNLSDSTSSIVSLIGFKIAKKSPDKDHPYGHERIEYVSALLVSCSIIVLSIILGKTSVERIINNSQMDLSRFYIIVILLSLSIIIKIWMVFVYKYVYKKIASLTSKASSQDSLNDVISTSIILVSLIFAYYLNVSIDAYLGLLLSIYMLISGLKLTIETISPLIGETYSKEEIEKIENEILSYDGILGVHDLFVHKYGPSKTFATIHCEVDAKKDVIESHNLIDNIERDFKSKHSINLTIHLDPVDTSDSLANDLKEVLMSITTKYQYEFHDFRIVKDIDHIKVLFDLVLPYEKNENNEKIVSTIRKEFLDGAKKIKDVEYYFVVDIDNKEK